MKLSFRTSEYILLGNEGQGRYFDVECLVSRQVHKQHWVANFDYHTNSISNLRQLDFKNLKRDTISQVDDLRIFFDNGKLFGVCSELNNSFWDTLFFEIEFPNSHPSASYASSIRVNLPKVNNEKNYVPILGKSGTFARQIQPISLVQSQNGTKYSENLNRPFQESSLRGSSQIVPYRSGFACIAHTLYFKEFKGKRFKDYYHHWIFYDDNLNVKSVSKPFKFLGMNIEFNCGLAFHKGEFFISFGVSDTSSFLLRGPEVLIDNIKASVGSL
jgi:hypothetical protein